MLIVLKKQNIILFVSLITIITLISIGHKSQIQLSKDFMSQKLVIDLPTFDASVKTYELVEAEELHLDTFDNLSVIVKFDIEEFNFNQDNNKMLLTVFDHQEKLQQYREIQKNYYISKNLEYVNNFGLEANLQTVSYFAPYAYLEFTEVDTFNQQFDMLKELTESTMIDQILLSTRNLSNYSVSAEFNSNSYMTNYPFNTALNHIEVPSIRPYTGDGIKVGVMDGGNPKYNIPSAKKTLYPDPNTFYDPHTTYVASIIGGNTGIARDAHLYFTPSATFAHYVDHLNWLINDQGVNVINMSMYVADDYLWGFYIYWTAYFDYVSRISKTVIVAAVGNDTEWNRVGNPAIGMNIIAIGNTGLNKKLMHDSAYNVAYVYEDILRVPSLSAPGGYISGIPNTTLNSGTSFSAPMVTGIIALLMEEFPFLITNPELIHPTLIASAQDLPTQDGLFDYEAGAGLVNYQKSRQILSQGDYLTAIVPNGALTNSYQDVGLFTLQPGETVTVGVALIIKSVNITGNLSYVPTFTKLKVSLINTKNNSQLTIDDFTSNLFRLRYTNTTSKQILFRVRLTLNGSKVPVGPEDVSISILRH